MTTGKTECASYKMQKSCSVTKDTQINNSTQVIRIGNKDIFFALSGKEQEENKKT